MCIKRNKGAKKESDPWASLGESWTPREKPRPAPRAPAAEGDLGVRLRADMLPASHASARFKAYRKPIITTRRMLTLLLIFLLAGLGWYFGIGPGRSGLEKVLTTLIELARQASLPTPTPLPSDTPTLPAAPNTPTPSATPRPTASLTPIIPTSTPTLSFTDTPVSTCRDFSTVTLEDVGLELCVQGTVINVVEKEDNTLIVFSNEAGALYLVTYDVAWPDGTIGVCYQVTGEIQRLLSSPVIVFGYQNLPTECP